MTDRPSGVAIADAVALVDLFLTVHPGYPLVAAVDLICDLDGIVDDRDRRVVRRGIEARLAAARVAALGLAA